MFDKCLLTGDTGFLGKSILEFAGGSKIDGLKETYGNINLAVQVPALACYDLVIHAAGKAHIVPKTSEEAQSFFDVNVCGTQNLLKALEKSCLPKKFVFISSVSVYGLETGTLVKETAPLLATDPYGLSKIEAEKIILEWCNLNGVTCTILRLPLLIAANAPGNLGAMIKGITRGYYFNISGGLAKKSMVLTRDVAKAIMEAAEIGGVYNLTDRYNPNFYELSNQIADKLGKKRPLNIPLWVAKIIALTGNLLGNKAPLNTGKLRKITSELTFDDSKAVVSFNWRPQKVLDNFLVI